MMTTVSIWTSSISVGAGVGAGADAAGNNDRDNVANTILRTKSEMND
jgi:hypothetical protein